MSATDCDYKTADETLKKTNDNNVKEAIVMILLNVDNKTAKEKLKQNDGFISKAIK